MQIVNLTHEVHLRWDCPVSEEEPVCHGQWSAIKGSTCNWRLYRCAVAVSSCCVTLFCLYCHHEWCLVVTCTCSCFSNRPSFFKFFCNIKKCLLQYNVLSSLVNGFYIHFVCTYWADAKTFWSCREHVTRIYSSLKKFLIFTEINSDIQNNHLGLDVEGT